MTYAGAGGPTRRARWWPLALSVFVLLLAAGAVLAAVRVFQAGRAGRSGEHWLVTGINLFHASGDDPSSAQLATLSSDVRRAGAEFSRMRAELSGAGPLWAAARVIPVVRGQVKGVDQLADAGQEISSAALALTSAADRFIHPHDAGAPLSGALPALESLHAVVSKGLSSLEDADGRIASLKGQWLFGPLGSARAALTAKLPRVTAEAASAQQGLRAFIAFAGGTGPRHYLFLSQDPEEVRPTGGFIGTYGLLTASAGRVSLTSYQDSANWYLAHPQAAVAESEAPTVFQIVGSNQNLANVNASPDWPTDAQLAARLWAEGGGTPIDGVVSMTPAFLARIVAVLGPVDVPAYNQVVTGSNLVDVVDRYTHLDTAPQPGGRKEFLTQLSKVVIDKLSAAPAHEWQPLARAAIAGFDADEAMAWSTDSTIEAVLAAHGWQDAFPRAVAHQDFFADSEFEFAAKNGAGLFRTFVHKVLIEADGSADVTTTMTIRNTLAVGPPGTEENQPESSYVVAYGPSGGRLLAGASTPSYYDYEPALSGHPATDWLLDVPREGSATVTVTWHVAHLLRKVSGGWEYSLGWRRLPAHDGDTLDLSFRLPKGWRWAGAPPPAQLPLTGDLTGTWKLVSRDAR